MNRVAATLLAMLLLAGLAQADLPILVDDGDTVASMDLNLRPRYILDGRDFNPDTGLLDYGSLRSQLGFTFKPLDRLTVRLSMKESRLLGTQQSNQPPTHQLYMQEAYFRMDEVWDKPIFVQAGRFELKYGRNRIMGPGNWNLYGPRSYDGFQLGLDPDYGTWELSAIKVTDYNYASTLNDVYGGYTYSTADRNMFVLAGELQDGSIQPILMADLNNAHPGFDSAHHRYTAGMYYGREMGSFKLDLDAAYQFGTMRDRDLSSWLFAIEGKYLTNLLNKSWIGLGLDMTSGNEVRTDSQGNAIGEDPDVDNVFYAPFMSRHVYRGYMDYWGDVTRGLSDLYLTLGVQPHDRAKFTLAVHNFAYMNNDYYIDTLPGGGGVPTLRTTEFSQIGQEVDLRAVLKLHNFVNLDAGYSVFLPANDVRINGILADGNLAHWAYCAFVVKF